MHIKNKILLEVAFTIIFIHFNMKRFGIVLLAFLLIYPSITEGASVWNQLVALKGKLETSDYVLIPS